ncbi:putative glycolipid-binding domain-containing protein [Pontibacillus salicampi]|uniref:Glycolipid-binding domain-containing protein n=1 Tax=Pontibacillus salicampi TaxID=1449801 RepID=A0ABV6LKG1_9BACI
MKKIIGWKHLELKGQQYTQLEWKEKTIVAKGRVEVEGSTGEVTTYCIEMDFSWYVKKVQVRNEESKKELCLTREEGRWVCQGDHLSYADQAVDVDLSVTPFSNSLPINRLNWRTGEKRNFLMLYIDGRTLKTITVEQQYTYLGRTERGRQFRYACKDYQTILTVDDAGLVLEYPEVFIRTK